MKDYIKDKFKKIPIPLIVVFVIIAPFYLTIGCPIRFFTGISCLGCGMSRAALALLHGDFSLAFEMHPMIYAMPFAAAVILFRKKIPKSIRTALFWILAAMMVFTYIYRLLNGSDIVCFEPENGFFYKTITQIIGICENGM